jgi:NAD(P)H dehydrogenase (quinone)
MDTTGSLWMSGALVGKPAGVFFSTAGQGGGQETIGLTIVTFFASMGMIYVPLGYTDTNMFNMDVVHGASPYGAGTYAKQDGSRQPSDIEKAIAETQGKNFATIALKLSDKKVEL